MTLQLCFNPHTPTLKVNPQPKSPHFFNNSLWLYRKSYTEKMFKQMNRTSVEL